MEKLAFSILETCRLLSLGRTSIYVAINSGELKAVKAGRRTLVTRESLQAFVANRPHLGVVEQTIGGGNV
jgi:excisionase family DNA binding protein